VRVRAKRNRHKGAQVVQPDSEEIWMYARSHSESHICQCKSRICSNPILAYAEPAITVQCLTQPVDRNRICTAHPHWHSLFTVVIDDKLF
jgi:hypothetical protein